MLHIKEEVARCLLCEDAPCTKACIKGDPARAIRAIRFDNSKNASRWIANCSDADLERAEQACIHYDQPIRIRELLRSACQDCKVTDTNPSLQITFCGIKCENPFFLASSAICTNYDMVARAFDMGWAGVFYKTICKQDIREVSPRFDAIKEGTSFAGFRNMEQLSENPYEVDFDILKRLKQNYPSKIVIASIMGQFEEEWIELAKMAEFAGCDAVELNFSCPQMPNITHMREPALGAYFAGADAISAINTIKSVTFSPEAEVSEKKTVSGYSGRAVKPIAQRFILEMAQNQIMRGIELSGIGGIETWRDALEYIQIGCRNVQVCTAVMEYGYRIIDDLLMGMTTYMAERGIEHLEDLVGEQLPSFVQPSELDRDTMVLPKIDREKCMGCGRCHISCNDGGHQAISFDLTERKPHIIGQKCVGCHLCRLVCPTGAIGMSKRFKKQ